MDEEVKCQIKWLLTEFQELRKETNRRSKEQFVCITASIISLGTLIGILSQNPSEFYPLLIMLSWVFAIFGYIWLDHSKQIFLIGSYIRTTIEKRINQYTNFDSENNIGWEHQINKIREKLKEQGKKPSFIIWALPLIYYIIPSTVIIFTYLFLRFFPFVNLKYELPYYIEIPLVIAGVVAVSGLIWEWKKAMAVIL